MNWFKRLVVSLLTSGHRYCQYSICLNAPKFLCIGCRQVFCGIHAHKHDEEVGDEVQAGS